MFDLKQMLYAVVNWRASYDPVHGFVKQMRRVGGFSHFTSILRCPRIRSKTSLHVLKPTAVTKL